MPICNCDFSNTTHQFFSFEHVVGAYPFLCLQNFFQLFILNVSINIKFLILGYFLVSNAKKNSVSTSRKIGHIEHS